jgi:type IV fimbrial biogenesis protein FimT
MTRRFARRHGGFTLTECCVTVALAAVLAGLALPSFTEVLKRRHLQGRASDLSTDLQVMRNEAVARNRTLRIAVSNDASGSCYVIHTGSADACRCDGDRPALCTDGAQALKSLFLPADGPVRLTAASSSTTFEPVRGSATPTNTFTLTDKDGRQVRHILSVMGRVRSCTTAQGMGGYKPC